MEENSIQYFGDKVQAVEIGPAANNKLSINYQEEERVLQVLWEGQVTSAEVRNGYKKIIDLVRQYKPTKWLLDLHNRELIKREDQRWVFTHVYPQALQLIQQTVFVAIILPVYSYHSLVNELNGDELMHGDNFLIMNHFLYQEEARRWLQNMTAIGQEAC
ncbi:hypothetical protein [Pontibacter chitinilyticus]|uniref:hypothetical protein n=1 Tax=Pontibacter chitinilyticus TaxID=2674989 RepID=UPI00321A007D